MCAGCGLGWVGGISLYGFAVIVSAEELTEMVMWMGIVRSHDLYNINHA